MFVYIQIIAAIEEIKDTLELFFVNICNLWKEKNLSQMQTYKFGRIMPLKMFV